MYTVVQLSSKTYTVHAHARTHVNTRTVEKNAVKLSTVFRVHAAVSPSSLSSSFHLRKVVYGDTSVRARCIARRKIYGLLLEYHVRAASLYNIQYNIIYI